MQMLRTEIFDNQQTALHTTTTSTKISIQSSYTVRRQWNSTCKTSLAACPIINSQRRFPLKHAGLNTLSTCLHNRTRHFRLDMPSVPDPMSSFLLDADDLSSIISHHIFSSIVGSTRHDLGLSHALSIAHLFSHILVLPIIHPRNGPNVLNR